MPQKPPSPSSPCPANRRAFFRRILLRGIEQAEQATHRIAQALPQLETRPDASQPDASQSLSVGVDAQNPHADAEAQRSVWSLPEVRYLRPPGALPEPQFLDACTRCGDCIRACPAQCIVIEEELRDQTSEVSPSIGNPLAYPHILPRTSPCVVCDSLACMTVCPTDALTLPPNGVAGIHMGLAVVHHDTCLRTAGEDCRLCVTQCPIGQTALTIDPLTTQVAVLPGCIGCGICERACPTDPASITVTPPP